MSHRPLALVSGLALGDYLLWNWSLGGGRDVLAIISGLSLLPLVLASAWLLALTLARALARSARPRARQPRRAVTRGSVAAARRIAPLRAAALAGEADGKSSEATAATTSSGKIAA